MTALIVNQNSKFTHNLTEKHETLLNQFHVLNDSASRWRCQASLIYLKDKVVYLHDVLKFVC